MLGCHPLSPQFGVTGAVPGSGAFEPGSGWVCQPGAGAVVLAPAGLCHGHQCPGVGRDTAHPWLIRDVCLIHGHAPGIPQQLPGVLGLPKSRAKQDGDRDPDPAVPTGPAQGCGSLPTGKPHPKQLPGWLRATGIQPLLPPTPQSRFQLRQNPRCPHRPGRAGMEGSPHRDGAGGWRQPNPPKVAIKPLHPKVFHVFLPRTGLPWPSAKHAPRAGLPPVFFQPFLHLSLSSRATSLSSGCSPRKSRSPRELQRSAPTGGDSRSPCHPRSLRGTIHPWRSEDKLLNPTLQSSPGRGKRDFKALKTRDPLHSGSIPLGTGVQGPQGLKNASPRPPAPAGHISSPSSLWFPREPRREGRRRHRQSWIPWEAAGRRCRPGQAGQSPREGRPAPPHRDIPALGGAGRESGRSSRWDGWPGAGEGRGFPENKAAAGCQRGRRRRGGRVPRGRASWGRGEAQKAQKKHKKSTGSLCFISLETPAPSQARPTGAAGQKALLLLPEVWSRRGSSILTPWGDIWGG